MNLKKRLRGETERIPDGWFRVMSVLLGISHWLYPTEKRAATLGIEAGMTVVDFGCGPGHYVAPVSKRVGPDGLVIALDVQELALQSVEKRARKLDLTNVQAALVTDYVCPLPDGIADLIYSLDVIHMVPQPERYFAEMRRLIKADGVLVIDQGHLPKQEARERILHSGCWEIEKEEGHRFRCRPT